MAQNSIMEGGHAKLDEIGSAKHKYTADIISVTGFKSQTGHEQFMGSECSQNPDTKHLKKL